MCPHCDVRLSAALRLAAFVDDPQGRAPKSSGRLARELQIIVEWIELCDHVAADAVDELRARREAQRLDVLLAQLAGDE